MSLWGAAFKGASTVLTGAAMLVERADDVYIAGRKLARKLGLLKPAAPPSKPLTHQNVVDIQDQIKRATTPKGR